MERKTGFEPATATLARWSSTGLSYFRSSTRAPTMRRGENSRPRPGGASRPGHPFPLDRLQPAVEPRAHPPRGVRLPVQLDVLPGGGLPGEVPRHAVPPDVPERLSVLVQTEGLLH